MSDSSQTHHGAPPTGSHYQPALSVVLVIVTLFVGATFFMLRYVAPASPSSTTTTLASSPTTTKPHSTVVAKSTVRVQVANGTLITGLARTFTQRLLTLGWDTLPQVNALGPKVTKTTVYFNPGFKWAATQIANTIHVGAHAVVALGGLRPVSGAASDDVIVILGPDAVTPG